jgi:hypothetical protein
MCPFGLGARTLVMEFFARVEMQIHLMMIASELGLRNDERRETEIVAGTY